MSYILIISTIFISFPDFFFRIFSPDGNAANFEEVMKYGRPILICAAAYNFFDAIYFIAIGALRGAGDTKVPMRIIICCAWGVLVPGMMICVYILNFSVVGIWIWIATYIAFVCSIIFLRFRSGKWKDIDLIETNNKIDKKDYNMEPILS